MTTLARLKAQAEAARDRFEEGKEALYRPDGEKLYADAEHEERLRSLRSERNEALDRIEAEVASLVEATTEEIEVLEHGDVTARLWVDELEYASARHTLIAADVATLTDAELKERLSAVARGGDRTSQTCYWLAARGRVSGDDPGMLEALQNLEEAIVPDFHRTKLESARRSLEEASEIKAVVYLARREQSSPYAPSYNIPGR